MATLKYTNKDGEVVSINSYKVNNIEVVQDTGQSEADVMSQKAVTDKIYQLQDSIDNIDLDVYVLKEEGKGLSTNNFTDEDKAKVDIIDNKADVEDLSNVVYEEVVNEESAPEVSEITREELKKDLFIDMWNNAWGSYGKYDPVNAPDAEHPFYGNEIWMTYEEALNVMNVRAWYIRSSNINLAYNNTRNARTFAPLQINAGGDFVTMNRTFQGCDALESIIFHNIVRSTNIERIFRYCRKLRIIKNLATANANTVTREAFVECFALETVEIPNLCCSISFSDSPLLSLVSLQYIVANASNTSEITITVHPDVYSKLTDESNTEWNQLVSDAIAKNITFVTPA